jgi:protein-tyrosine phosphatase
MGIRNPSNFRDLASHVSSRLKPGRLFRSDHFGALDATDAEKILALGIRRVIDFRGVSERVTAVCALQGVAVHSLPIEPTIVQKLTELIAAGHQLSTADVVALMQDTYRGFVRHNTHRFQEFFSHLLEAREPLVFHCTAGKDRTGFAAALILRSLDVPHDDVMRDYLLTNERLKRPDSSRHDVPAAIHEVLWGVQPEFLNAAFAAIDSDYGSLQAYTREALKLGRAEEVRLRELYLEPGP